MVNFDYVPIVKRAQEGDVKAFAELVGYFQDVAVAGAFTWLGDLESARDATQDAFLEAHLNLYQLRSGAAFPGWFRRIVYKHCDRMTRRKSLSLTTIDSARDIDSPTPNPEQSLLSTEMEQQTRLAVEALPEQLRLVVSLHYFAGVSGSQISEFLELPISTIKKRLRDARKRLREENIMAIKSSRSMNGSSKTRPFAEEILFYIALRQGDFSEVRRMIKVTPTLVDAQQNWNRELVYDGVLPFATRATALITAIEVNNLQMQTLLLDEGADVDGRCGCATAESPIWSATLLNRHAHAKQLLERGADPNVVSASGNTSLHIAAMRGQQELTRLLLEHGADPTIRDTGSDLVNHLTMTGSEHSGRTPAQWASINHHVEVVDIIQKNIEEHADSGTNEQNESGDNRDNRELFCENGELLNSGIKALDFFSPVPRGGLVRVPFKSGVGMVVLLGELSHRFFSCESGVVVWTGFTQPPFDLKDWEADMSEFGMKQHVLSSLVSFKENASKRRESYQTGLSMIEAMRDAGRDVLAIVLSTEGFENDVEESLIRLSRLTRTGSVTSIVMTPFRDVEQAWDELKPPYSAQITLDYRRALKSLFPAIDPDRSMSNALDSSIVGLRHAELLGQVRELFAWYRTLDPDFELLAGNGDAKTNETDNDQQKIELVQRLLRFFCQPFMTAEPFSGKPGEFVTRSDLLDGLGEILSS